MKITKNLKLLTTTQSELARCLGLSHQRINQLVKSDVVVKGEDNSVLVIESIKNYYAASGNSDTEDDSGNPVDYWVEKALHEKAKREIAEIRVAKMQNQIYDARTVELVMIEMLSNLRTQLLGIPSKLAPQLEDKSKDEIYSQLTKEIEEKLSELSEYSPAMFNQEEIIDEDGE